MTGFWIRVTKHSLSLISIIHPSLLSEAHVILVLPSVDGTDTRKNAKAIAQTSRYCVIIHYVDVHMYLIFYEK